MSTGTQLAVIGAGPAGLAAALAAREAGLAVTVIDQNPAAGGQIYRGLATASDRQRAALGPDYVRGDRLLAEFAACGAKLVGEAQVWDITDAGVALWHDARCEMLPADQIILATGAMERPSPLPGWTLPGVLFAGAVQILMKQAGLVPSGRVALVGNGPLLLLLARQLRAAGVAICGFLDTRSRGSLRRALPHLPGALQAVPELLKGLSLLRDFAASGVPHWRLDRAPRIETAGHALRLDFFAQDQPQRLEADLVLLHHGVIPNTQLTRLLRLPHDWDTAQQAWRPRVGHWGETSRRDLRIVGDAAGIDGALAAEAAGHLAGLGAALTAGRLTAAQAAERARHWERLLHRQRALRPLLDALYAPPPWLLRPADDVTVCRCENVSAGTVRAMAKLGCRGPNQTKFFSRCGMGACQGRMCGDSVTQLLAEATGLTSEEVGQYRLRPPLVPIPLAALATLAQGPSEASASEDAE